MSDVESGKYYEKDGAFRVIYQVGGTHPWVHFSKDVYKRQILW